MNHEYLIPICPSLVWVFDFFFCLSLPLFFFFLLDKRRRWNWNKHARHPCGAVNALNWTEWEEIKCVASVSSQGFISWNWKHWARVKKKPVKPWTFTHYMLPSSCGSRWSPLLMHLEYAAVKWFWMPLLPSGCSQTFNLPSWLGQAVSPQNKQETVLLPLIAILPHSIHPLVILIVFPTNVLSVDGPGWRLQIWPCGLQRQVARESERDVLLLTEPPPPGQDCNPRTFTCDKTTHDMLLLNFTFQHGTLLQLQLWLHV